MKTGRKTYIAQLVWVIFFFAMSACGSKDTILDRRNSQAAERSVKVSVVNLGANLVSVTARPTAPVRGGSLLLCVGDVLTCDAAPANREALTLFDGNLPQAGAPTSAVHKSNQNFDRRSTKFITIYAQDMATSKPLKSQVSLDQTSDASTNSNSNPNSNPQPPVVVPQNPSIDRFTFDQGTLERASQKLSGFDFDYEFAQKNIKPTIPALRLKVTAANVTALKNNLGVVIGGYALSDSSKFVASNTSVTFDSQGGLIVVGENLKPATVYKLRLHFFDRTDRTQSRYVGSSTRAYYYVTDAESDQMSRIRARIVMRGLAEEYDWSLNRYDSRKDYTHGAGGWCHIFYNWVIKPYLKTRSGSENTHYSSSYWSSQGGLIDGSALLKLSQSEPIMGDYFRVGSHAAMILAYDVARSQFITLEGNFNNRVEISQRSVNGFSWVGHIKSAMLRDDAIQSLP